MTKNEAIEELKYDCDQLGKSIPCDTGWGQAIHTAYGMAIEALEEIQQYRAIGTPEECREAVEKQKARKTLGRWTVSGKYEIGECPSCHMTETSLAGYCGSCGQKLDWGDINEQQTRNN